MTPLALKLNPAGSDPATSDQEYVPAPPAAANCALYDLAADAVDSLAPTTDKDATELTNMGFSACNALYEPPASQ